MRLHKRAIGAVLVVSFGAVLTAAWVYESPKRDKFAADYIKFFDDTATAFEANAQQPEMDRLRDRACKLGERFDQLDLSEEEEDRFLERHSIHPRNSLARTIKAAANKGEVVGDFMWVIDGLNPDQ